MFYVYGLHLEGDNEIRYVGSSCNPKQRFFQHLCEHSGRSPDKEKWVADNRRNVRMKILQSNIAEKDRRKAEERAIMECRGKGHRLLNVRCAARNVATTEDVTWWLDRLEGEKPY